MFPTINGKCILECCEEDLKEMLENPNFMENEYLEYKQCIAFMKIPKERTKERQHEIDEFKSDICSFANAYGGYIFYGISENDDAIPKEIVGMDIDSKDDFLLCIKDQLSTIYPRIPNYKSHFIDLQNGKQVLVLFIYHDYYAPYIHISDNKFYYAYKRGGNSKTIIPYMELKNMFTQSLSLEKEIDRFRKERVEFYQQSRTKFVLLHIIPEMFLDENFKKKVYALQRNNKTLGYIFGLIHNYYSILPSVDGMRVINDNGEECRLYNSFIAEYFAPIELYKVAYDGKAGIAWGLIWDAIRDFKDLYLSHVSSNIEDQRLFICCSIVGCKGFVTEASNGFEEESIIDRNLCFMEPVVFERIQDNEEMNLLEKTLKLEFLFSIGVRNAQGMGNMMKEVYGDGNN